MKIEEEKQAAAIRQGETSLGIELGSTRIKAVLIDKEHHTLAMGSHEWENHLEDHIWTYSIDEVHEGLRKCYQDLKKNIIDMYGIVLKKTASMGFSAMMHGYMVFDREEKLLVPFRTWRNNLTEEATKILTPLFGQHIPQRWSIAHLYQAILNGEKHVSEISYMTTLSGYVHWKMTGRKVLGIGDASGMFPIDSEDRCFYEKMLDQFDELVSKYGFPWKIRDILPKVLCAGQNAGALTKEGALWLDPEGDLLPGIPVCPPEGDAGTGMTATNAVSKRSGNVSAGTSVFAMIVLEKALSRVYEEIDMVTTPDGSPVAMVHSQNCTSDLNAWVKILGEAAEAFGVKLTQEQLYSTLYKKALEGDKDCGGLLPYCYISGEHITHFEEGRPLFVREENSRFTLANFMRSHLYTSLGALKLGMDILWKEEGVVVERILGHGGFFKTPDVGQKIMAAVVNAPVAVMETAGEGGAWGIALLASYMEHKKEEETLGEFLQNEVFSHVKSVQVNPEPEDVKGFEKFMERYKKGLSVERAAVDALR